jgi:GT2 family glycosyltransferase
VKLVRNASNLGSAKAKNQGVSVSSGDLLWFLDSDSLVTDKHCLKHMVELIKKKADVGAVGGEYVVEGQQRLFNIYKIDNTGRSVLTKTSSQRNLVECDYLTTANCLIKKDLFLKINGFDPDYFYLAEDKELGYRLKKLGLKNLLSARTALLHRYSPKSRPDNRAYLAQLHKSRIRFILNNFELPDLIKALLLETTYFANSAIQKKSKGSLKIHLINALYEKPFVFAALCHNLLNIIKLIKARKKKLECIIELRGSLHPA